MDGGGGGGDNNNDMVIGVIMRMTKKTQPQTTMRKVMMTFKE